ncbi:Lar family restriction alleviation protein [Pseudomonas aeruginosa]|uniref:Lar family restriction alleviation protein n=1 Tax=Pseudomonas aeruginosa TaxID=287 RepID=UPI002A699918|nr:Lar family restriction alleviation protein [Pseudomonas aeruginosa]MDY1143036.1 Lar family restriction alleviation protein [Pseudomonas aeruginosa]MDY1207969.1 Lar family restriction alleviation protein [Pseudomonas aeruginosa]
MAEELKPCPFCGETPGVDSYAHADGGYKYGSICCSCGVIGPDVRTGYKKWPEWRDAAVAAWNERAVPAGHVMVSEGLLRRVCAEPPATCCMDDEMTWRRDLDSALTELRALLSEQE